MASGVQPRSSAVSQTHRVQSAADHLGLPHREPFVFVRELVSRGSGNAQCLTWFNSDDAMFAGHFPGDPLVPGVILTEALAQTAGIAAASAWPDREAPLFLLSAIRAMKFLRAVRPGQQIKLHAKKLAHVGNLMQFAVTATVQDATVAEGELVLSVGAPQGV